MLPQGFNITNLKHTAHLAGIAQLTLSRKLAWLQSQFVFRSDAAKMKNGVSYRFLKL